jgi:signal transduction histidine kinase
MTRILVIDDDPMVGKTLVDLLGLHGYPATRTESGELGLEALSSEPFDLVLLDLRLPGLNGFETCQKVRETYGPSLPVIMMTAFGDPVAVRRGYEAGADDFLHKPVDTPALILKVRAFLRLKSMHDELARSREEAQARARDLAQLHEIGRDWSLIAEPADFNRMLTQRLAELLGAPIVGIALFDPSTQAMEAALPVHGLSDERSRAFRYVPRPEYRSLWNPGSGRPHVSNQPANDLRLAQELPLLAEAESAVLVPLLSAGELIGLLGAADKPGGFTDADVQILSTFAGPVATFLRSRLTFDRQRSQAGRFERLAALVGDMAALSGHRELIELTVRRLQSDLGYDHVAYYASRSDGSPSPEAEAGSAAVSPNPEAMGWALRLSAPLESSRSKDVTELAVPVRAGGRVLGALVVSRKAPATFDEEETSLLSTLGGHLALALRRADSEAATEHLARQMATLYDLGLETAALQDLQALFTRASEESGRLIRADFTSVFRFEEGEELLRLFAAWARQPAVRPEPQPVFRLGEGIAGRVARDLLPVLVNDVEGHADFVPRENPVARLLCVPLTHYDRERGESRLYGVLNATRQPGSPPFTNEDLDYLTRFAGQLSIAAANAVAFARQRERSEQLALVNAVLRETAGMLSRERILDAAVRRIQEAFRPALVATLEPEVESGLLRVVSAAPRGGRSEGWPESVSSEGAIALALSERRTIASTAESSPAFTPLVAGSLVSVAVPIVSGDEVAAVLYAESDRPGAFDSAQVITLETLAEGIGILLRTTGLYETVEKTNARLVELDRTKSELVNVVAHDFRAPLSAILGWAEMLESHPDADEAGRRERAGAIVKSATRMAGLMDRTLETTRLETGQFAFEFGLVDLSALLRSVVGGLSPSPDHRIVLDVPEEPLPCWADGERIAEVVENLLSNAIKYSPGGGDIRLTARRQRETAVVSVADRGIGIPREKQALLFRPFSRVHDRKATGIEGFGLGLSICERIVRAHGGGIEVESVPGEGSIFSFTLSLFGAGAQAHSSTLVVAAADSGTRREVRTVAEACGFAVHEVADGVEAVEAVTRLRPAALVLDRILPRLQAEEVAERLAAIEATREVALVVLAEAGDLGPAAERFRACLARPLDRRLLERVLEGLGASVG